MSKPPFNLRRACDENRTEIRPPNLRFDSTPRDEDGLRLLRGEWVPSCGRGAVVG